MVSLLLPPFRPAKATASAVTPELLACVFVREEFLPAQGHGCLSLTHLPLTCWHACSPISEAVRQLCPLPCVPEPRSGLRTCPLAEDRQLLLSNPLISHATRLQERTCPH